MDPRTNEPIPVASREDSFILFLNDDTNKARAKSRARPRACPLTALLALTLHMISSGGGIALSVLVYLLKLQVTAAGNLDLVARILLFGASCMGPFYVIMHLFAAREHYVRSQQTGSPQIYGYFTAAVAVLVMRLGLPVWLGAVVISALVAAMKGLDLARGIRDNLVWVQLGIAALGM